jgi:hypothetical protein
MKPDTTVSLTERIELLEKKLTNCIQALTFAINGWDESDPYIVKLRATRDGAEKALDKPNGASAPREAAKS